MEGAIQAGERAAREILCELGCISVSDIYLPEPQSEVSRITIPILGTDHAQQLKAVHHGISIKDPEILINEREYTIFNDRGVVFPSMSL